MLWGITKKVHVGEQRRSRSNMVGKKQVKCFIDRCLNYIYIQNLQTAQWQTKQAMPRQGQNNFWTLCSDICTAKAKKEGKKHRAWLRSWIKRHVGLQSLKGNWSWAYLALGLSKRGVKLCVFKIQTKTCKMLSLLSLLLLALLYHS